MNINIFLIGSIYLSYNQITVIPKEIGNLINLHILDLSFNQITVTPKEIANLFKMRHLFLHNNQLYQDEKI